MRSIVSTGNDGRPPLAPVPPGENGSIKPTGTGKADLFHRQITLLRTQRLAGFWRVSLAY